MNRIVPITIIAASFGFLSSQEGYCQSQSGSSKAKPLNSGMATLPYSIHFRGISGWEPENTKAMGPIAFSRDGRLFASTFVAREGPSTNSGFKGKAAISVWNCVNREQILCLEQQNCSPSALVFSPDGKILVSAWQKSILFCDILSGRQLLRMNVPEDLIICVAFASDSKRLICVSINYDRKPLSSSISIWDSCTGQLLASFKKPYFIDAACVSLDGRMLAWAAGDIVRVMSIIDGTEVFAFTLDRNSSTSVSFSFDGTILASTARGESHLICWDLQTGIQMRLNGPDMYYEIACSANNSFLAAGRSEIIDIWDISSKKKIQEIAHYQFGPIAFSKAGTVVTTASYDGEVLVQPLARNISSHSRTNEAAGLEDEDIGTQQFQMLWEELAQEYTAKVRMAMKKLTSGRNRTVIRLSRKLNPACAPENEVNKLIARLDHNDFKVRELATNQLQSLDKAAETYLITAHKASQSVESRRRIQFLLKEVRSQFITAPEVIRTIRGIEVLERIATTEAQEVLRTLAEGDVLARPTLEAKAALLRLGQK